MNRFAKFVRISVLAALLAFTGLFNSTFAANNSKKPGQNEKIEAPAASLYKAQLLAACNAFEPNSEETAKRANEAKRLKNMFGASETVLTFKVHGETRAMLLPDIEVIDSRRIGAADKTQTSLGRKASPSKSTLAPSECP